MQSRCASTTTAPLQQFGSYVTRNHTVILHLGLARCLPNVPASCSPRFDRTISTTSEQGFGAPVAEGHMTESVVSTCEAAGIDLAAPPAAPPAPRRTLVLSGGGGRGVWQVGACEHLILERGYGFDLIAGVSAEAVNGATLAQAHDQDELEADARRRTGCVATRGASAAAARWRDVGLHACQAAGLVRGWAPHGSRWRCARGMK